MIRPTSRTPALLVFTLLALLPAAARAQTFSIEEWKLTRLDTGELLDTQTERDQFFNSANCDCQVPLSLEIRLKGETQSADYDFAIVAGQSCLDTVNNTIRDSCLILYGPVRANSLTSLQIKVSDYQAADGTRQPLTASALMESQCQGVDRRSFAISMFTEPQSDQQWQQDASKLEYTVDTQAPAQPRNPSLKAGEGQVTISFDSHTSSTSVTTDGGTTGTQDKNFLGYQVLCETVDGAPALSSPRKAEFNSAANVCGSGSTTVADAGTGDSSSTTLSPDPIPLAGDGGLDGQVREADMALADAAGPAEDAAPVDAGPTDVGGSSADSSGTSGSGAASLGSAYVCSSLKTAAGSISVTGLANGNTYRFYLVTIDDARNPSTPLLVGEASPELAEDLWERYKRSGGAADPGYCFVATAVHGSYDHPHVRVLRQFRDQVLLRSSEGRKLVQAYYATSPRFAHWLARHEDARSLARVLLWPFTAVAAAHLYTTPAHKGLLLLSLVLGCTLVVRRRRSRRTS